MNEAVPDGGDHTGHSSDEKPSPDEAADAALDAVAPERPLSP